jgi:DNA-directed RNA polymerase specialized sigma24 family protein
MYTNNRFIVLKEHTQQEASDELEIPLGTVKRIIEIVLMIYEII